MPESEIVGGNMPEREIARVAFRAPPVWKTEINLWFLQVESNFIMAGIEREITKFHCVIAALDMEILSYVKDIVENPPADNPYKILKERIVKHFTQSESSRLRTLLQELHLGDKKPTQLLHEMRSLAGSQISDDVLKTLFIQRLPINIQQILSISKDKLEDLAQIADKINEVSCFGTSSSEHNISSIDLRGLQSQISELSEKVEKLTFQQKNFNKGKFRQRSRSRSRSNSNNVNKTSEKQYCWYHFKFGKDAKKCVGKCSYSEN